MVTCGRDVELRSCGLDRDDEDGIVSIANCDSGSGRVVLRLLAEE